VSRFLFQGSAEQVLIPRFCGAGSYSKVLRSRFLFQGSAEQVLILAKKKKDGKI